MGSCVPCFGDVRGVVGHWCFSSLSPLSCLSVHWGVWLQFPVRCVPGGDAEEGGQEGQARTGCLAAGPPARRSGGQPASMVPSRGLPVWEGIPSLVSSFPCTVEQWFQRRFCTLPRRAYSSITQTTLFSSRKQLWEAGGASRGVPWACATANHFGDREAVPDG